MKLRLLVVIVFIIISLLWWMPSFNTSNPKKIGDNQDILPEFTAELLHQEIFDENGNIHREVFSKKMEHYSELSLTHFEQPEFILYQQQVPHWRISAQMGNMQDGKLVLDEQVIMLQIIEDSLVKKITTEYLEIDLNNSLVTTDKKINIEGNDLWIEGQGLVADLNLGTIKLTNHVQTRIK